jgi:hypothetical protein
MTIYEQILAGLQTKFTGVDSATLTRVANNKAVGVTDETKINSIIEGVSFSDVMTNYADFRANEASKTAVANYEKKFGIKDGKKVEEQNHPEPTTPPIGDDNKPDMASAIQEAIKSAISPLTDEITKLKNERSESEFSSKVSEAAKKYGISESLISMLNVPKDANLDDFMQNAKQAFTNAGYQEVHVPESADLQQKTESENIAKKIADDTKSIVEQRKSN